MEAFVISSPTVQLLSHTHTRSSRSVSLPSKTSSITICRADGTQKPQKRPQWRRISEGIISISLATALALSPGIGGDFSDYSALAVGGKQGAKGGGGTFQSASGRVNKDAESLLRWGLPVENKDIRQIQSDLEDITYDIRAMKWPSIEKDVKKAQATCKKRADQILGSIPADRQEEASEMMQSISTQLDELATLVMTKNPEEVIPLQRGILREVGNIEQMMIATFPYEIPAEYKDLPQLKGRAVVEMKVKKAEDEQFDIDGTLYDSGKMTMVVDGYTAPITSGNFVDLVKKGFYNKMEITRSDGFVIQTGDPAGDVDGYIDPSTEKIRRIPLEIFPRRDSTPLYGVTLEDDGRATEQTALPFTSYGTLGMAREEFDANTASSQFFWFLFEPDLTPAGRNLLDGRYAVFGYVTDGEFFLRDMKAGDIITEAKVVSGLENLIAPKEVSNYKGAELERG